MLFINDNNGMQNSYNLIALITKASQWNRVSQSLLTLCSLTAYLYCLLLAQLI